MRAEVMDGVGPRAIIQPPPATLERGEARAEESPLGAGGSPWQAF